MTALPPDPLDPPDRVRRRIVYALVVVVLVALGVWYFWGRDGASGAQNSAAADANGKAGKAGAFKGGAGKAGAGKGGGRGGFDPNRAQPVAVAAARLGNVDVVQTALGTVNALRTVSVRPRVDGQLNAVSFAEGQLVPAGAVLAQIDPASFQVAVNQAEGQLARDAAQLANARLDLKRYQTLIAQDSIPEQQVDQQAALVKQLEGTVKMDQANLDSAKLQLSYTKIVAPVAGRTGLRQVDPGNAVRQTDANGIVVITQVDPISVVFTIPQDALPRVLERMRANDKPAVQALDRDLKGVLASGYLLSTDNVIDVSTGTVKLKAQLPNSNGKLFPNQFVNVRMVVDTHRNVITVPTAAVQLAAQGPVVYVVKDDNTVEVRPVKTGAAERGQTEITSGLQQNERVIIDGVDRIREGAKVEVVQPGANQPGAGGGGRRGRGGNSAQGQPQAPGSVAPSPPAGTPSPGAGPSKSQDTGNAPGNMKGAASTDPNAPANNGEEARREAFRKRLESMTPEQREEAMKRMRERRQQQGQDSK